MHTFALDQQGWTLLTVLQPGHYLSAVPGHFRSQVVKRKTAFLWPYGGDVVGCVEGILLVFRMFEF